MVLSVSRRTDIPRYYFPWFLNRLEAGFVLVRNPMNHRQVSRVPLGPEAAECIAFWSKDPAPMLPHLAALEPRPWFIQFTLNPYGPGVEPGLPAQAARVDTFRRLAAAIGPRRVVWRYSPILLGEDFTVEQHLRRFEALAKSLAGHTRVCRISFLDIYRKIAPQMRAMGVTDVPGDEKPAMVHRMVEIAGACGITLGGCGNMDLAAAGLAPVGCIDAALVAAATGRPVAPGKDPNQREDCYCMPSVDIGSYNNCPTRCAYCYANRAGTAAAQGAQRYDPAAPMLCDALSPFDTVTKRKMPSCLEGQLSLF